MIKCKLGELLSVKHGYAFKSEKYVEKSQYALVTLANISVTNNFQFTKEKNTYYGSEFPEEFILKTGDLIMPLTEQVIGLFGNSAFVPEIENITFILNQRVGKVIPKKGRADIYYLHYLLSTNGVRQQLEYRASGTRQRNISPKDIYDIDVFVPDYEVQRKIGRTLYSLEKRVNLNNKISSELEAMEKTIYDYWFLQFEFPNEEGKPYKSSGGKMVWNEEVKREIPVGWKVKKIGETFSSSRGVSYNSKNLGEKGVPMINLASFKPGGGYKIEGVKKFTGDYDEDKCLKAYDLVMCNTQQTAIDYSKDIIGNAFLIPDIFESDIVSSHHVTTIKVKNENIKYYLCSLFNTKHFHRYIAGFTNGTNILGLLFNGVENYKCEIPDERTLERYSIFCRDIEKRKSQIIKENQELTSLRDFLLPLLMNGQVSFKE